MTTKLKTTESFSYILDGINVSLGEVINETRNKLIISLKEDKCDRSWVDIIIQNFQSKRKFLPGENFSQHNLTNFKHRKDDIIFELCVKIIDKIDLKYINSLSASQVATEVIKFVVNNYGKNFDIDENVFNDKYYSGDGMSMKDELVMYIRSDSVLSGISGLDEL